MKLDNFRELLTPVLTKFKKETNLLPIPNKISSKKMI